MDSSGVRAGDAAAAEEVNSVRAPSDSLEVRDA
jgi:hypothetical protein